MILHSMTQPSAARHKIRARYFKFGLWALSLNVVFGSLFYWAEHRAQPTLSYSDALWWAMVTMTTVGYGDVVAQTWAGRYLVSYPCFIIGIGFLGLVFSALAERIFYRVSRKRKGLMTITHKDHIIICNCPGIQRVSKLISELRGKDSYREKPIVLITDRYTELPDELEEHMILFVHGQPTSESVLEQANLRQCEGVFILPVVSGDPASDAHSFTIGTMVEMISEEVGRSIRTVVDLVDKSNVAMMSRSNVDAILHTQDMNDSLIVQEYLYPGIHHAFDQLITNRKGSHFFIHQTQLAGMSFVEMQMAMLQQATNIQLVGLVHEGAHYLNPEKQTRIQSGDQLIILAEQKKEIELWEEGMLASRSQS